MVSYEGNLGSRSENSAMAIGCRAMIPPPISTCFGFSGSLSLESGALPRIGAHYRRMMGRPTVKKTIATESAIGYALPR